jgi:PTH2 family peptidyl-tRNA hydrolase
MSIDFENLTIIIRPDLEAGFLARVPELPGCMSDGDSYEEALANVKDAIYCWKEAYIERGQKFESSQYRQVILVRSDLKLRRGKEIAQGAHASLAVTLDHLNDHRVKEWLSQSFTKITLKVTSEEELLEIVAKAQASDIPAVSIRDNGLTETGGVPTYIAAAIGPETKEVLDQITGHLSLY